jgi:DNA-binding transcriptional LysR family regulator
VLAERFPELERVLPEAEAVVRDLWLVFHRDLRKSRPMRVITEELIAEVRPIFARDA